MATCKDCIHDKVCSDWANESIFPFVNGANNCEDYMPTADLVPRSEGELTKAHIQAHYEAIYALADMVCQFGYNTTFRKQKAVCDGGLSALEYAFGALLDCGCKTNSNGTITLKNLWAFQEEMRAKMEGGE